MTARTSPESARDIPEATVARLPVYLRALTTLSEQGTATCSSEELAAAAGVNSAKLRKDLSYLGSYGTRGVGYDVDYLRYQIAREIGVTQDWPVVIVGIGNLGHALANYSGFRSRGFRVVALLDADPDRHGEVVAGVVVRPFDDLERIVARARRRHRRDRHPGRSPRRTSPTGWSRCGITSILNFAPTVLSVPERRRRAQGRPVHRAADPRLPRAAQGRPTERPAMPHERPGRGHLPPLRARRPARAARARPRRACTSWSQDVAACEHVTEATVIATCNRLEIYADVDRFHGSVEDLSRLLVERAGETAEAMLPHLYVHYDDGAVSHLFQVAAGLDSMAVGEGQILGQTREALRARPGARAPSARPSTCCSSRPCGSASARTPRPTSTARRRRWSAPRSTAPSAAVGDLAGKRVLVVGAGAMAGLATATVVARSAPAEIIVVNRSAEQAARLAARVRRPRRSPLAELARRAGAGPTSSSPAPARPACWSPRDGRRRRAARPAADRRSSTSPCRTTSTRRSADAARRHA